MFLQLSAEADLGAVLPAGPVVGQDEVGVAAVRGRQLAERVGHGLIGPGHLKHTQPGSVWLSPLQSSLVHRGLTYVSPDQVFFVLDDPPRRDADSTDFPPGLGRMIFQSISNMADHS